MYTESYEKNTYKTVYVCYVWILVCYAATESNIYVNMIFGTVLNTFLCLSVYYFFFIVQSA